MKQRQNKIDNGQTMTEKLTDQKLELLRRDYVEGIEDEDGIRSYPTIEALCRAHNVSRATLYRRTQEADWQGQRNAWQAEYTQQLNMKRAQRFAKQADALDSVSLGLAQGILNKLGRRLRRSIEDEENQEDTMSTNEIKDLAEAGLKAQKMGKLALGEAAEITKVTSDEQIPASLSRIIRELDELAEAKSQRSNYTLQ